MLQYKLINEPNNYKKKIEVARDTEMQTFPLQRNA